MMTTDAATAAVLSLSLLAAVSAYSSLSVVFSVLAFLSSWAAGSVVGIKVACVVMVGSRFPSIYHTGMPQPCVSAVNA